MSRHKRIAAVLALLMVVMIATSCGKAPDPVDTGDVKIEEVRIGAIYPLTGALAPTGFDLRYGIELAVEIINNSYPDLNLPLASGEGLTGLDGARISIVWGDHYGSPETGMSEAERLITSEDVVALLGCFNSNVTATASQAAERLGIPFVNPESTSPMLTRRGFEYFFRVTPDDDIFAKNFFDFMDGLKATKEVQIGSVGILWENTLWGTDVAAAERGYAEQYGYSVVADIPHPNNSTSVVSEVQTLKAANPDVVLQASYVSDAILFTNTFDELDFNPKAVLAMNAGHIDSAYLQTVGAKGEYIFSREVWALDLASQKPIIEVVNQMFFDKYGINMNGNSARTFTGMFVLAEALNRAGSTDPDAIRAALKATDISADQLITPWDGVKFDETGQNFRGNGIIVQVQDGKYWTVWPFDLASKEIIWPMPRWSDR